MTWDFAEANLFSDSSGSYNNLFERQIKGFEALSSNKFGQAQQVDAQTQSVSVNKVISSDPPIMTILLMPTCRTFSMSGYVDL